MSTDDFGRNERPWGFFEGLLRGEGHQVKILEVAPGQRLSLQLHHRRAERWVVLAGRARVLVGDESLDLQAGGTVQIPLDTVHRLENPGEVPLRIIEIQTGDYLGEDDIVRFEDDYGRA